MPAPKFEPPSFLEMAMLDALYENTPMEDAPRRAAELEIEALDAAEAAALAKGDCE